jgi:carboxyl-terminal processing protease
LYVKFISFRGNAVEFFKKALDYGTLNGFSSLIVDVRDNLGGELDIFAQIADMLLPEGETFYVMMRSGEKTTIKSGQFKVKWGA